MILRNSISTTKKLFQKTVERFKSFVHGGYQRLPKTTPFSPFACNGMDERDIQKQYREFEAIPTDFTNYYYQEKAKSQGLKKEAPHALPSQQRLYDFSNNHEVARHPTSKANLKEDPSKMKAAYKEKKTLQGVTMSNMIREERTRLVGRKLKELKIVDKGNVEHVLDIEMVLHYYSQLTCPAFLEIIDNFIMDMYSQAWLSPNNLNA